jgi:hypothetical protein
MEAWLQNARKAAQHHINKGTYQDEVFVSGEWQPITRHFNKYTFYDSKRNMTYGRVEGVVGDTSPAHSQVPTTDKIKEKKL